MKSLSAIATNIRVAFADGKPYAEVECILVLVEKEYEVAGTSYKSETIRFGADVESLKSLQKAIKNWIDAAESLDKRLNKKEEQGELFK